MKLALAGLVVLALAGTLAISTRAQDRDHRDDQNDHHDNGKHNGWSKHEDRGEHGDQDHHDNGNHYGEVKHEDAGYRHDNGEHRGWDNPHNPHSYAHWDYNRDRIRPGHPYPYGHYDHVRDEWVARSFDVRARRIVLFDRSNWVVASYDAPRCRDWDWDHDRVFVYNDDDHPGWYLLFNARLGAYVHVEFAGIH
jgi:hypothetical protein